MNRARDRLRGFSLVEMLVVVAIIMLLAAAAAPALRDVGSQSSRSMRGAAHTLRQYLRSARTYAIENRVKAAVCYVQMPRWEGELDEFTEPGMESWWTGYVLVHENPDGTWHRFRGGMYAQRIVLPDQVHIEPGRMVPDFRTTDDDLPREPILRAFRDPDRPSDVPYFRVMGYTAFRPSGMGTVYRYVGDEWVAIPLAGQSQVHLYDDRVLDGHITVNIVNSTGAVKLSFETRA